MNITNEDIKWYGTEYGGFFVAPKLLKPFSKALCVGVGEDISFDLQLIGLHNMSVLAIDPTLKAKKYVENISPKNYQYINYALVHETFSEKFVKMYENKNPDWVSESLVSSHNSVSESCYDAGVTKLSDFKDENFSLIKLDIEGAEYSVIDEWDNWSASTLCIEFHHHCTNYSESDTERCIKKLYDLGYKNIITKNYKEVTLIKV